MDDSDDEITGFENINADNNNATGLENRPVEPQNRGVEPPIHWITRE
jgi:hypothetical protein